MSTGTAGLLRMVPVGNNRFRGCVTGVCWLSQYLVSSSTRHTLLLETLSGGCLGWLCRAALTCESLAA